MKYFVPFFIFIFISFSSSYAQSNDVQSSYSHNLNILLSIPDSKIEVSDTLTFSDLMLSKSDSLTFSLRTKLKISHSIPKIMISERNTEFISYKVAVSDILPNNKQLTINYAGIIADSIIVGSADYARGFSETKGLISEQGTYLAASTFWVPDFKDGLFSFRLDVLVDTTWNVVSQGTRLLNKQEGNKRHVIYNCPYPMEEIYLIGADFTEYATEINGIKVKAFLRDPEPNLALMYLDATVGYLEMFEKLIGPYPYGKFALVENFWETGYGMPSFTLLGQKIIRFPWILYSSYPHELLHNWWGNSVYIDYETGNWCEGITAYQADHLMKEQMGKGSEYRRECLQKFTNFVNDENDFPVIDFRSRSNAAEESIGYGKVLMMNHMLRMLMGDSLFNVGYADFYQTYKFKKSSFADIRASMEKVSGQDFSGFFQQWTTRKSAPTIVLKEASVKKGKVYQLTVQLSQTQKENVFSVRVPIAVYLEGDSTARIEYLDMNSRDESGVFSYRNKPLKVVVDPLFDVFRKLDSKEVPIVLSQLFGSNEYSIILPQNSPFTDEYRKVALYWKSGYKEQGVDIEILNDNEIERLPDLKSSWIFGFENKFVKAIPSFRELGKSISTEDQNIAADLKENGALVFVTEHPVNNKETVGFIGASTDSSIAILSAKLPHYGKYSYLGFEGPEVKNKLKGIFPISNSPLHLTFPGSDGNMIDKIRIMEHQPLVN